MDSIGPIPWTVFWPYFAGVAVLLLSLLLPPGSGAGDARGLDQVIALRRVFLAAPMAVFGSEHFVLPNVIAKIIPSWIPGHLFFTYFVGTCLIAAALAIAVRRHSGLAAALLGLMLFCFVVLIWVPNSFALRGNRFVLAVLLRDLSFSGGFLALAVTEDFPPFRARGRLVAGIARSWIGVAVLVFGIEHFLYPEFVPVIPLQQPMPAFLPAHTAIAYLVGAGLIAGSLGLLLGWHARAAAALLGVLVLGVILLVYLPLLVAEPSVEVGLNYFFDTLLFGGTCLALAGALPRTGLARLGTEPGGPGVSIGGAAAWS